MTDTADGSTETLSWLVECKGIEPPIQSIDKSRRKDGTQFREHFTYHDGADSKTCPGGKEPLPCGCTFKTIRLAVKDDIHIRNRASKADCENCSFKPRSCSKTPTRTVTRSIHECARDLARDIATTDAFVASRRARRKVEMLFAQMTKIMGLTRLRLRGPNGAKDEFTLAAAAQNLRKMAKSITASA